MGVLTIDIEYDKVNQKTCVVGYCQRMKARRSRFFCHVHVKHEEVQKKFDTEFELLVKIDEISIDKMKKAEVMSKQKEKTKALAEKTVGFIEQSEKRDRVLNPIIETKVASLLGKRKASDPETVEISLPAEVVPKPASKFRRTVAMVATVVAFAVGYMF